MLNIKVRGIRGTAKYLEVKIEYGGTEIDLGLLDAGERRELATILETAQDELLEGLDDAPEIFPGTLDALRNLGANTR